LARAFSFQNAERKQIRVASESREIHANEAAKTTHTDASIEDTLTRSCLSGDSRNLRPFSLRNIPNGKFGPIAGKCDFRLLPLAGMFVFLLTYEQTCFAPPRSG
jgi:hypothetical protein